MASFFDLAMSRRSTREFVPGRQIPKEWLIKCVEAARHAPSACNSQPWKFLVMEDLKSHENIRDGAFSGMYGMNAFARDASSLIAIAHDKQKIFPLLGGAAMRTDFRLVDIGIACSHIVMQAADLGIATCILGWFNEKLLRRTFGLPGSAKIELVMAMGFAVKNDHRERPLKDIAEVSKFI